MAGARRILSGVTSGLSRASSGDDAIVGYRTFVAVIAAAYLTLIALTPRTGMMMMEEISWPRLLPLCALYLGLGIWGFDYARRRSSLLISVIYLLIEFAIGMGINRLAWEGSLPLILLPLAAQGVVLLPRALAAAMCLLVIAGVSGSLSWVPAWPQWLRNIAQADHSAAVGLQYHARDRRDIRQRPVLLQVRDIVPVARQQRQFQSPECLFDIGAR